MNEKLDTAFRDALREATNSIVPKELSNILKKAREAALRGENCITLHCTNSNANYRCIRWTSLYHETPLVKELKKMGFTLRDNYGIILNDITICW